MRVHLIEGAVLIALAVVGIVDGYRELGHMTLQHEVISPGAYVIVVGAGLLLVSSGFLIADWKRAKTDPEITRLVPGRGITVWGIFVGYVLLVPLLGYALGSFVFFVAVFYLLGMRPWLRTVLVSVAFTAVFYLVFVRLANIWMPSGWFGYLF